MSNNRTPEVKLDWSRLLGFDQAAPAEADVGTLRPSDRRLVKLGAKVGDKRLPLPS